MAEISDWTGRVWAYEYDLAGNLTSAENPLHQITEYEYDTAPLTSSSHPHLTRVILPADRDLNGEGDVQTSFDYYENGRAFGNANAFGHGEEVDYDLYRKRTRIADARGFITAHYFDENGELTKLTTPDGGVRVFRHTADGRRWEKTDPLGATTQYSYCATRTLDGCPADVGGNVTLESDPLGKTIEYDYDTNLFDAVVRIKDKNDAVRTMTYYPGGKLQRVEIAQLGAQSNVLLREFQYYPDGNLHRDIEYIEPGTTARSRTTTYTYGNNGLNVDQVAMSGTDGTIITRTFTHDTLGRTESETLLRRAAPGSPAQVPLTTSFAYDDLDRVVRITDALGNEVERDYDANGNLTDQRHRYKRPDETFDVRVLERRAYDDADRLVSVKDVYNAERKLEYDEDGNLTRIVHPLGSETRFEYDEEGRQTSVIDPNGYRREAVHDLAGRIVAVVDANGNRTSFEYDALGRSVAVVDALGDRTEVEYDGRGNVAKVRDANAVIDPSLRNAEDASSFFEYDELGRLVRTLDALGGETFFEYDLLGNRTRVTDAGGEETRFTYDDLGRLLEIADPLVEVPSDKVDTFEVDEAGNVVVSTDREGVIVHVTFDELNRPSLREFITAGTPDEVLTYDIYGNLESAARAEVTYDFTYDDKNRLLTKADGRLGKSLAFEYDAEDRLVRKTDFQDEVTDLQYDAGGRLVAEGNSAYLSVSYHYDPAGRLLNRILSSGAQTDYGYDATNRLVSLRQEAADGSEIESVSYDHDAVGNVKQINGDLFGYDALHRLELADYPGTSEDRSFTYDAVGNWLTSSVGGSVRAYEYGDGNRLLEVHSGSVAGLLLFSFEYDGNGRVTTKRDAASAAIYQLTRDSLGQVTAAGGPGGLDVTFGYDAARQRVRRSDPQVSDLYHLEGEHLEAVYAAGGSLRAKYLRGSVIDEVVTAYYFDGNGKPTNYTYHHDALQSVVGLSGHAGTVEETLRYGPFGELLSPPGSTPNRLRFTGREFDAETGLYYYRARYYDPEIGRFLSEDPLGFDGGDVNLYAYVGNNPLRFNDPSGRILQAIVGGVIGLGTSLGTELILSGGNLSQVSVVAVIGGTVAGALTGGLSALTTSGVRGSATAATVNLLGAAGAGVAGNTVSRTLSGLSPFDPVQTPAAAALGLIGGGTSLLVGSAAAPALAVGATTPLKVALLAAATAFEVSLPFEIGASQLLDQPVPIGPPDDFNPTFDFPSTSVSGPLFDAYCSPKCF